MDPAARATVYIHGKERDNPELCWSVQINNSMITLWDPAAERSVVTGVQLAANTYYHLDVSFKAADNLVQYFLNGTLLHECSGSAAAGRVEQVSITAFTFNGAQNYDFDDLTFTPEAVCCPADFNCSETVGSQDIFDFLAAYFSSAFAADFNRSGTTTVQDIFDFLAAYFAGCP